MQVHGALKSQVSKKNGTEAKRGAHRIGLELVRN